MNSPFTREEIQVKPYNPSKIFVAGGALLALLAATFISVSLFEHLDAKEIMVVQSPVSGKLSWYKTAGVKWQGLGKVTKFEKRSQLWFSSFQDQGKKEDQSIKARFNDGGHANLSGSISWEMPLDEEHLDLLYTKYGNQDAIQQQLIRTTVERCVYMTGPLMSSKESSAEKRPLLLQYLDDQIQNGVFLTATEEEKIPDPMTGEMRTVNVVKIVKTESGAVQRVEESPLRSFGIKVFNLSLNEVKYDDAVESQIQTQQKAIMEVQTAIAQAKKAEQAAITAAKNGEAAAATAKWEQEVIRAKEVTAAEQRRDVAKLDAEAAALTKQKEILLGEGESTRKRLVMQADGALDKKLEALVRVNELYAQAIEKHPGSWTPTVVMGSAGTAPGGAAVPLVDMLTARTALQLGIDLGVSGLGNTKAAGGGSSPDIQNKGTKK